MEQLKPKSSLKTKRNSFITNVRASKIKVNVPKTSIPFRPLKLSQQKLTSQKIKKGSWNSVPGSYKSNSPGVTRNENCNLNAELTLPNNSNRIVTRPDLTSQRSSSKSNESEDNSYLSYQKDFLSSNIHQLQTTMDNLIKKIVEYSQNCSTYEGKKVVIPIIAPKFRSNNERSNGKKFPNNTTINKIESQYPFIHVRNCFDQKSIKKPNCTTVTIKRLQPQENYCLPNLISNISLCNQPILSKSINCDNNSVFVYLIEVKNQDSSEKKKITAKDSLEITENLNSDDDNGRDRNGHTKHRKSLKDFSHTEVTKTHKVVNLKSVQGISENENCLDDQTIRNLADIFGMSVSDMKTLIQIMKNNPNFKRFHASDINFKSQLQQPNVRSPQDLNIDRNHAFNSSINIKNQIVHSLPSKSMTKDDNMEQQTTTKVTEMVNKSLSKDEKKHLDRTSMVLERGTIQKDSKHLTTDKDNNLGTFQNQNVSIRKESTLITDLMRNDDVKPSNEVLRNSIRTGDENLRNISTSSVLNDTQSLSIKNQIITAKSDSKTFKPTIRNISVIDNDIKVVSYPKVDSKKQELDHYKSRQNSINKSLPLNDYESESKIIKPSEIFIRNSVRYSISNLGSISLPPKDSGKDYSNNVSQSVTTEKSLIPLLRSEASVKNSDKKLNQILKKNSKLNPELSINNRNVSFVKNLSQFVDNVSDSPRNILQELQNTENGSLKDPLSEILTMKFSKLDDLKSLFASKGKLGSVLSHKIKETSSQSTNIKDDTPSIDTSSQMNKIELIVERTNSQVSVATSTYEEKNNVIRKSKGGIFLREKESQTKSIGLVEDPSLKDNESQVTEIKSISIIKETPKKFQFSEYELIEGKVTNIFPMSSVTDNLLDSNNISVLPDQVYEYLKISDERNLDNIERHSPSSGCESQASETFEFNIIEESINKFFILDDSFLERILSEVMKPFLETEKFLFNISNENFITNLDEQLKTLSKSDKIDHIYSSFHSESSAENVKSKKNYDETMISETMKSKSTRESIRKLSSIINQIISEEVVEMVKPLQDVYNVLLNASTQSKFTDQTEELDYVSELERLENERKDNETEYVEVVNTGFSEIPTNSLEVNKPPLVGETYDFIIEENIIKSISIAQPLTEEKLTEENKNFFDKNQLTSETENRESSISHHSQSSVNEKEVFSNSSEQVLKNIEDDQNAPNVSVESNNIKERMRISFKCERETKELKIGGSNSITTNVGISVYYEKSELENETDDNVDKSFNEKTSRYSTSIEDKYSVPSENIESKRDTTEIMKISLKSERETKESKISSINSIITNVGESLDNKNEEDINKDFNDKTSRYSVQKIPISSFANSFDLDPASYQSIGIVEKKYQPSDFLNDVNVNDDIKQSEKSYSTESNLKSRLSKNSFFDKYDESDRILPNEIPSKVMSKNDVKENLQSNITETRPSISIRTTIEFEKKINPLSNDYSLNKTSISVDKTILSDKINSDLFGQLKETFNITLVKDLLDEIVGEQFLSENRYSLSNFISKLEDDIPLKEKTFNVIDNIRQPEELLSTESSLNSKMSKNNFLDKFNESLESNGKKSDLYLPKDVLSKVWLKNDISENVQPSTIETRSSISIRKTRESEKEENKPLSNGYDLKQVSVNVNRTSFSGKRNSDLISLNETVDTLFKDLLNEIVEGQFLSQNDSIRSNFKNSVKENQQLFHIGTNERSDERSSILIDSNYVDHDKKFSQRLEQENIEEKVLSNQDFEILELLKTGIIPEELFANDYTIDERTINKTASFINSELINSFFLDNEIIPSKNLKYKGTLKEQSDPETSGFSEREGNNIHRSSFKKLNSLIQTLDDELPKIKTKEVKQHFGMKARISYTFGPLLKNKLLTKSDQLGFSHDNSKPVEIKNEDIKVDNSNILTTRNVSFKRNDTLVEKNSTLSSDQVVKLVEQENKERENNDLKPILARKTSVPTVSKSPVIESSNKVEASKGVSPEKEKKKYFPSFSFKAIISKRSISNVPKDLPSKTNEKKTILNDTRKKLLKISSENETKDPTSKQNLKFKEGTSTRPHDFLINQNDKSDSPKEPHLKTNEKETFPNNPRNILIKSSSENETTSKQNLKANILKPDLPVSVIGSSSKTDGFFSNENVTKDIIRKKTPNLESSIFKSEISNTKDFSGKKPISTDIDQSYQLVKVSKVPSPQKNFLNIEFTALRANQPLTTSRQNSTPFSEPLFRKQISVTTNIIANKKELANSKISDSNTPPKPLKKSMKSISISVERIYSANSERPMYYIKSKDDNTITKNVGQQTQDPHIKKDG